MAVKTLAKVIPADRQNTTTNSSAPPRGESDAPRHATPVSTRMSPFTDRGLTQKCDNLKIKSKNYPIILAQFLIAVTPSFFIIEFDIIIKIIFKTLFKHNFKILIFNMKF